jgi:hypothetical protein
MEMVRKKETKEKTKMKLPFGSTKSPLRMILNA